ncbi:hypothetical protein ACQR50_12835 [Sphingomonas sp. Xoc002]|uniref:hypothetical protein n=1 Tax=Sphingomonas sp. Xoc002 TaxID=2837624 RepID=UPI003D184B17
MPSGRRLFLIAPTLVLVGASDPPPMVREVPPDGRVTVTIDGQAIPARIGPGLPAFLYLPRARADALFGQDATIGRSGFSLFSATPASSARIGPIRIAGRVRRVMLGVGDALPETAWVKWFETDVYPGDEALGGPHVVPEPIVRFTLRASQPDDVEAALPLASRDNWWLSSVELPIGGHDVTFAFAPQFPRTVASAAAGAAIGRAQGAQFDGAVQPVLISHGVSRPARPVRLARPLVLGPLRIAELLVRTHDYGSATDIDPSEADGLEADRRDVVVKGKRTKSRPSYVVYIGADMLNGCSSITYDKPGHVVTLRCRATG